MFHPHSSCLILTWVLIKVKTITSGSFPVHILKMGCVTVTSLETPTRPERINVITAKGKLFGKAPLPLSPLINKSTGAGKLQNHGFLVVRKRRSLTVSTSLDQGLSVIEMSLTAPVWTRTLCGIWVFPTLVGSLGTIILLYGKDSTY